MRTVFVFVLLCIVVGNQAYAQQTCRSFEYKQQELLSNPALGVKISVLEEFIQRKQASAVTRKGHLPLITIPVVIHVIYNNNEQNISDAFITNQLDILSKCFRRQNADSVNTPLRFLGLAADCDIEFKLAVSDPKRRPTTGIIRKYTSVKRWESDDQVKYSSKGGDDAWSSDQYLNIWLCNLAWIQGYASFPGGPAEKDGIVMNYSLFRSYNTIVHEAGHWLGLRHTWGDELCGDDMVDDTPKQSSYSSGCPTGIRRSCNNEPAGDMYMNYMDVTESSCVNLFTEGQKKRMRTVFEAGGARFALLSSPALLPPTNYEIPLPEKEPKNPLASVYPNPATTEITLDISADVSWIGNTITITSLQGLPIIRIQVTSKLMKVNVSSLKPGVYFITAKRENGTTIKQKLVKI